LPGLNIVDASYCTVNPAKADALHRASMLTHCRRSVASEDRTVSLPKRSYFLGREPIESYSPKQWY
jgi:hypothetical protein